MRQNRPNEDLAPVVMEHGDQPVFVATNVKNRLPIHVVGTGKRVPQIVEVCKDLTLHRAVPHLQRVLGIRVFLPKLNKSRLGYDMHRLILYRFGIFNKCHFFSSRRCSVAMYLGEGQNHFADEFALRHRQFEKRLKNVPIESHSIEVAECIYTRLAWPVRNGGLERAFIHWAQADSQVQAFCKISENRHTFARLRYVKDDRLPAFYSPDFLVRTEDAVYLVETKAKEQVFNLNVQRKLKAALAWVARINDLSVEQRGGAPWHYVLLAENVVYEWQGKGARLAELLGYARLRPLAEASHQGKLI